MALFPLMGPGDNIIASTRLYGGTVTQFTHTIRRFGWSAEFADTDDLAALEALADDRTRAIFCELIANPGGYVTDIPAARRGREAPRRAADRRQHLGDPLPLPPARAGRRPRRPLDHQVPDRQRHRRRRRDRRLRPLRLVRRGQVPEPDRARARLPRPEVPRDLRPDGLHLPLASPSACATSA